MTSTSISATSRINLSYRRRQCYRQDDVTEVVTEFVLPDSTCSALTLTEVLAQVQMDRASSVGEQKNRKDRKLRRFLHLTSNAISDLYADRLAEPLLEKPAHKYTWRHSPQLGRETMNDATFLVGQDLYR